MRNNFKAGPAKDLGKTRFRSSWERNYARYLNWCVGMGMYASWKFEPKTFWFEGIKRGTVSYLPDFEVTLPDGSIEYHEVKGWMDAKSRTKLKRMAKYFPEVKLVLIDSKVYKALCKDGGKYSAYWEVPAAKKPGTAPRKRRRGWPKRKKK